MSNNGGGDSGGSFKSNAIKYELSQSEFQSGNGNGTKPSHPPHSSPAMVSSQAGPVTPAAANFLPAPQTAKDSPDRHLLPQSPKSPSLSLSLSPSKSQSQSQSPEASASSASECVEEAVSAPSGPANLQPSEKPVSENVPDEQEKKYSDLTPSEAAPLMLADLERTLSSAIGGRPYSGGSASAKKARKKRNEMSLKLAAKYGFRVTESGIGYPIGWPTRSVVFMAKNFGTASPEDKLKCGSASFGIHLADVMRSYLCEVVAMNEVAPSRENVDEHREERHQGEKDGGKESEESEIEEMEEEDEKEKEKEKEEEEEEVRSSPPQSDEGMQEEEQVCEFDCEATRRKALDFLRELSAATSGELSTTADGNERDSSRSQDAVVTLCEKYGFVREEEEGGQGEQGQCTKPDTYLIPDGWPRSVALLDEIDNASTRRIIGPGGLASYLNWANGSQSRPLKEDREKVDALTRNKRRTMAYTFCGKVRKSGKVRKRYKDISSLSSMERVSRILVRKK